MTFLACGSRSEVVTGASRTSHPFLVMLCEASDASTPAIPRSYYQQLITDPNPALDNVYNFFLDQSYGAIDIGGTTILDWTRVATFADPKTGATTPATTAELRKHGRGDLVQFCADAVKGSVANWKDYQTGGVIAVWNLTGLDDGAGCCVAAGGLSLPYLTSGANPALGGADPTTVAFFTHEMTHDLGVNHAHGPYDGADHLISTELDTGATHVFGSITNFEDYGDCWSIMGCGLSTFATSTFGAAGPGLNGAERAIFDWTPHDRVFSYDRSGSTTVTLAPRGTPKVSGMLLVKIPVGSQGYYTVEYVERSGWDRNVLLNHAVLIHEVRASDPSHSYLVSRNIYGAWLPGQVFLDPGNRVRVSIGSFEDALGTATTVTLSAGGAADDGSSTCAPLGYLYRPTYISSPNIILEAPLDGAHAVAGVPVTFQATVTQLVGTGSETTGAEPLPESQITWTDNSMALDTKSTFTHTFTSPGDHIIEVAAYNKYCLSSSRTATLHVDAPPSTPSAPSVSILQPVDGTTYEVNPPSFTQSVSLVGSGTSNVDTFTWTDTLTGFLGTGEDLPVNLKLTATGNCAMQSDTITLRGSTSAGAIATASITVTLRSTNCIR